MKILSYKTLILVFLLNIVLCAQVFNSDVSKKGTTAAPFLSIGQGARAISMGSAFVAVADDPSTIYWNPAGLAKLTGIGLVFDHTQWIADISYNYVAASYNIGEMGTLGFSFTASNIGDMNVTTIDEPNGTGEVFNASDVCFSLAYAINLTDNFALGISPKFIYQKIWKMDASAFAMDLGVTYKTPFDGMILAMSIANFGTKMQMLGNSNLVLHDLDPLSTGNNGKIPAYLETNQWSLPLTFRVGVAYNPINTENHRVTIAVDALHPSDNYESVNVGGEYTYNNFISFRGGYKALFLQDSEERFTLGFGIRQAMIGNLVVMFDYAYQDFGRFSNIQKFSVGISF